MMIKTEEKTDVIKHPTAIFNTANFRNCRRLNCLFIDHCKKEHSENIRPSCIHPEEQIIYDIDIVYNATGETFLDNIAAHLVGTSTPILEFDRVRLTTKATIPDSTSTIAGDGLTLVTKDLTKSYTSATKTILATATVLTSEGNTKAPLVTGTPASKSVFTVDSVTGLNEGDLIDFVQSSPYPKRVDMEILDITGSTITLTSDLDVIPVAGNTLQQKIGRIYLIDENDIVISVFKYRRTKSSDQQIAITYTMTLRGS